MSNKTEATFHGRILQDELRAAAQESDDYSLLMRAAKALDQAQPDNVLSSALADTEGQQLVQAILNRKRTS